MYFVIEGQIQSKNNYISFGDVTNGKKLRIQAALI